MSNKNKFPTQETKRKKNFDLFVLQQCVTMPATHYLPPQQQQQQQQQQMTGTLTNVELNGLLQNHTPYKENNLVRLVLMNQDLQETKLLFY